MIRNLDPRLNLRRDPQTVTPDGARLGGGIDGLAVHTLALIEDSRGSLIEVYRPEWGLHADPLVSVYQVVARPGSVRGWVVHDEQDDRIFVTHGTFWWAFFDARVESPTYRQAYDVVLSDQARPLLVIPAGVLHAAKNIGSGPAIFLNMPTRPYDHESPDKYRTPMDGVTIPFVFPGD